MEYWTWNKAIAGHFFKEEHAGKTVVLYLDRALITTIGQQNGIGGWEEYVEALQKGPDGFSRQNYPSELLRSWQPGTSANSEPPFFLALLGLLVIAWTERAEGQYSYYGALRDLLQEEKLVFYADPHDFAVGLTRGFALVEAWCRDRQGRLGLCSDEQLHAWRYVGRIKYHALIRPEERQRLHYIWADGGLNRNANPGLHLLIALSSSHDRAGELIPNILHLLRHASPKIKRAVEELIEIDFRNWDGKFSDPATPDASRQSSPMELHCCMNRQGETGLRLYHPEVTGKVMVEWEGRLLQGEIQGDGWTGWLENRADGTVFHPALESLAAPEWIYLANEMPINYIGGEETRLAPAESLGASGLDYISTRILDRDRRNLLLTRYAPPRGKDDSSYNLLSLPAIEATGWYLYEVLPNHVQARNGKAERDASPSFRLLGGRKNQVGQYSLHALPQLLVKGIDEPRFRILSESPYRDAMRMEQEETGQGSIRYAISFEPDYQPEPGGERWVIQVVGHGELEMTVSVRLPLRQYRNGDGWEFSGAGKLLPDHAKGISHARVVADRQAEKPAVNRLFIEYDGFAEVPPLGYEFPERLLECGREGGIASYDRLLLALMEWIEIMRGFPPDRADARHVRQRLAALGYYLAIPEQRLAQLAPPAMVRLPENLFRLRFLLTGIWTRQILKKVRDWCDQPEHGIRMLWRQQADPVLPPTAMLETVDLSKIVLLAEELEKKFPGYVQFNSSQIYTLELLRSLETASPPSPEGVIRLGPDPDEAFLNPGTLSFQADHRPEKFPAISQTRHYRMGYGQYTWWEDAETGFACDGSYAIWQVLAHHKQPFLFRDPEKSDRIYMPGMAIPPLLERGLVHASGKASSKLYFEGKHGQPLCLLRYDGIRSNLRLEIPRILLGLTDTHQSPTYYHPLDHFINS